MPGKNRKKNESEGRAVTSDKKRPALPVRKEKNHSLAILVHPEKCTGCGACEEACSTRRTGRKNPDASSIRPARILPDGGFTPLACAACHDVRCASVCPGDALFREGEFGAVRCRPEKCSGCASCMLSCPFGVLHMGERRAIPLPCDLCEGTPECVKSCHAGALELVDLEDKNSLKKTRKLAAEVAALLKNSE